MRQVAFVLPAANGVAELLENVRATHRTVCDIVDTLLTDDGPGEECVVHLYFERTDSGAALLEAKYSGLPIGGKYSARKDTAHASPGQIHLHLFVRGNELGAINLDGTGHDGCSGVKLPRRAAEGIRRHFPQFRVPDNNIIESAPESVQRLLADPLERLLLEEGGES